MEFADSIGQILKQKGDVFSMPPSASVYDAVVCMAEKGVGALLVMEEGKVVGILSERDYARKIVIKGKNSKDTPVHEIMSSPVIFVTRIEPATTGLGSRCSTIELLPPNNWPEDNTPTLPLRATCRLGNFLLRRTRKF